MSTNSEGKVTRCPRMRCRITFWDWRLWVQSWRPATNGFLCWGPSGHGPKCARPDLGRFTRETARRMWPATFDAGNRHGQFDERGWETGRCRMARLPRPSSTLFFGLIVVAELEIETRTPYVYVWRK